MKTKNFFQCWDCRMKGIDCYCDLNPKKEILKLNKEIEEELKNE